MGAEHSEVVAAAKHSFPLGPCQTPDQVHCERRDTLPVPAPFGVAGAEAEAGVEDEPPFPGVGAWVQA